ncbi:glycoside hydrolase family 95-like protein [Paenibacillus sp. J2TS4]|uniref:glycosyl hydrolase family 95 catalytic domain-containing protein n=1 Tax=Paenibacillus sp. J2TS4 TaxID=2807194 RepID=UPI001B2B6FF1|nr:hypothetical protein [Paenibacillus sp. J2TS4]GIP33256.1 hypothetical protein J2TS4_24660 [Paenibacillus sp. J2TS4]
MIYNSNENIEVEIDWTEFMSRHDMSWSVRPLSWNEGAFIGNGLLGAMIYSEEHRSKRNVLRFVLGRTDVTAQRPDGKGFPVRVPIGELDLELEGMIYQPADIQLDLWNAELRAHLPTTQGEVRLRAFIHSEKNTLVVELNTSSGERTAKFQWYAYPDVDPVLKNADGINFNQYIPEMEVERGEQEGVRWGRQIYPSGEGCLTAWKEIELAPDYRVLVLTVAGGVAEGDLQHAVSTIQSAGTQTLDSLAESHRDWWHDYYRLSFVSIPDTRLEGFYWIQMYKLASATRAHHLLIDNQGPWLTTTPWPGVWFNMNVQMSYSPVYASNRLDIGQSLIRALDRNQEQLIRNVPEPFRHDSAGLGRSCSYDLASEVGTEVGNLTWLCHSVWRHYQATMDDELLRTLLYPVLRRSVHYYLHILEEGEDGLYHLPPTVSPEYGSFKQLTVRDCHYDLALLRWGCQTLLDICDRLAVEDELAERWQEVLDRLVPYPYDGQEGFLIGEDTPLEFGHRHFSHLLAAFPLHLIGDSEEDKEKIRRTLRHWIGQEGDLRGFSFTGAASIAAILGSGSEALRYLHTLMHLIKPNTMYREAGPVIESPLAGAEAIHELLLQSWGGVIRIFPAVPDEWSDAVFHQLRAEGAFLVSAVRKDGQTQWIRIESLAGEPCRIRTGWPTDRIASASDRSLAMKSCGDGIVELDLRKGEAATLYLQDEAIDFTLRPVAAQSHLCRFFGGNKPWRLYGLPLQD